MAKMGLSVRDDPRKVVDVAGRSWGEPVRGLALSVIIKPKEDDDELPSVCVAILNRSTEVRLLKTRGWLYFFQVSVVNADGAGVAMTPYGHELFKRERMPPLSDIALDPAEAIEADIPIGAVYVMPNGRYRVQASCELPEDTRIVSNEIEINV